MPGFVVHVLTYCTTNCIYRIVLISWTDPLSGLTVDFGCRILSPDCQWCMHELWELWRTVIHSYNGKHYAFISDNLVIHTWSPWIVLGAIEPLL